MKKRLLFLLETFLWTIIVFKVAKVVFMLCCGDGHVFTADDVWQVLRHGFTLDVSTALYILVIPYLASFVSIWTEKREGAKKWLRNLLRLYFFLMAGAMSLAFVADTSLYPFWGYKLDASCLQYIDATGDATASVTPTYLLLRLLFWLLAWAFIYLPYTSFLRTLFPPLSSLLSPHSSLLTSHILLLPLIIIGIRGGVDESTTNVGQVYYSQDQFLNHSAVNPVFSFLASFEKTASENTVYEFYSQEELRQLTDGLYDSETLPGDTLLNTQRPNVVLILLESCGKMFLEVMPHLQEAASEGIDFTNCYANSYRTDRGTVCALSGYLSFPTMSVMKMSSKVARFPGIARTLQHEGYQTDYLYGGDINFTKMKGYLVSTGFEHLHWKQDYTQQEQQTSKWGVRDDITFKTLSQMVLSQSDDQPFLIGYSTLSTHEPWDVPVQKYPEKEYNGFSYLDDCIGEFLREMKASPQWKDLLIVMMPDHSCDFRHYDEQHPDRNRIPMIWTGGAVKGPKKVTAVCNQSDCVATLFGQMGLSHADFPFSRDVTSPDYRHPFAVHMFNNGISMVDSTGFVLYDLTADRITAKTSVHAETMSQTAKAILQLASEDLKAR